MLDFKIVTADPWEPLTKSFSDNNYRQVQSFADEAALHVGAECEFLVFHGNAQIIGACAVRIKSALNGFFKIAYVNWGPLTGLPLRGNFSSYISCVGLLKDRYVTELGMVLRICEPPSLVNVFNYEKINDEMLGMGFELISSYSYQTIIKDILDDDGFLKASLHKKWRSELNRSFRSNFVVEQVISNDEINDFQRIFDSLVASKGLIVDHDFRFYRKVLNNAGPEEFILHLVKYNNEVVSGHLGSFVGDTAVYLLGATTSIGRKLRASYFLHWEVMRYCRSRGIKKYDLGGIDPLKNESVYRFKKRFNGRELKCSPIYDSYPSRFEKGLFKSIYSISRFLKYIKSKFSYA